MTSSHPLPFSFILAIFLFYLLQTTIPNVLICINAPVVRRASTPSRDPLNYAKQSAINFGYFSIIPTEFVGILFKSTLSVSFAFMLSVIQRKFFVPAFSGRPHFSLLPNRIRIQLKSWPQQLQSQKIMSVCQKAILPLNLNPFSVWPRWPNRIRLFRNGNAKCQCYFITKCFVSPLRAPNVPEAK